MNRVRMIWPHISAEKQGETLWADTVPTIPWAIPEEFTIIGSQSIIDMQKVTDTAYVRRYIQVTIDPKTGLLFQEGKVLWGSTDFPQRERTPLLHKHLLKPKKHVDKAIVLHHAWDNNYFHFFLIIAPKLYLAEKHGIGSNVPVIVSKQLANQKFFQESVSLGLFDNREIVVQSPGEIISAHVAYAIRSHEYDLDASEWICSKLNAKPLPQSNRRLYIHRGNNVRRFRNQNDLNQLLDKYGVDFFDPQKHSLREQIDTVSQASLIVGAHGAGLTNMMFRHQAPCKVIELLNPSWCGAHYYLMAKQRGFDYHWILNKNESQDKQATVDADLGSLEKLLQPLTDRSLNV